MGFFGNKREPEDKGPACPECAGTPCEHDVVAVKLNKRFNGNQVLRDFELRARRGETFVIMGRSGCGKSVFLKHVIGLLHPDSGRLCVLGRDLAQLDRAQLLELRRNVGMVFQGAALLNSLSVRDNVGLGLSERLVPQEEIDRIVKEKLELVNLAGRENLMPDELSGGMRKRVAVARTLALNPRVILYDEPTAGLDPVTCDDVDELMMDMKKKVGATSVVVTHDLITAYRVADRMGMLHEGCLIEVGTPEEFRRSKNEVIRNFTARNISREAR